MDIDLHFFRITSKMLLFIYIYLHIYIYTYIGLNEPSFLTDTIKSVATVVNKKPEDMKVQLKVNESYLYIYMNTYTCMHIYTYTYI
jgi:hypothetical protein